jgi:hypothetical protein
LKAGQIEKLPQSQSGCQVRFTGTLTRWRHGSSRTSSFIGYPILRTYE